MKKGMHYFEKYTPALGMANNLSAYNPFCSEELKINSN
jgi:hypothetical protein